MADDLRFYGDIAQIVFFSLMISHAFLREPTTLDIAISRACEKGNAETCHLCLTLMSDGNKEKVE